MSADAGGQNIALGMKVDGASVWVELQDQWYEIPAEQSKGATDLFNGTPDQILANLGVDPMAWGEMQLAGTEEVDGAMCYHLTVAADPEKVAADVVAALNSEKVQGIAGSQSATVDELKKQNAEAIEQIKKSLSSASADYWIDAETFYVRKGTIKAEMEFSDPKATQGLESASLSTSFTASGFNESVTVEPPADALPFDQLMNGLFDMSGTGGGTSL